MPAPTLDPETVRELVTAAAAAPSIHNTQPWRFRRAPGGRAIEVHSDETRRLPHEDPDGRALHVSVGAALFNLRCALTHAGLAPLVRVRPDPARPGLAATVAPGGPAAPDDPLGRELYDAIPERHSSRLPYTGEFPPSGLLRALREAARAEGVLLHVPDADADRLRRLVAEAEYRDHADPDRRRESRAWIREGGGDGLPPAALGPYDAAGRLPVRDFGGRGPGKDRPPEVFEEPVCLAVLLTRHDTPADWLAAGQALERVLLLATARGLVASLLHQPLEWHDLRWEARDPVLGPGHPQMVLRLGYGPPGPATPRRPAGDVLDGGGS